MKDLTLDSIELSCKMGRAKALVSAVSELTQAGALLKPQDMDTPGGSDKFNQVFELLRNHDTAATLLFVLYDLLADIEGMIDNPGDNGH